MKGMKEDKKRYSGRTILRLGRYMLQYKWMLTLAFLCTLGSNLFSLIGPKLTGLCIGAVEPGRGAVDFGAVFYYGAWMAGFYALCCQAKPNLTSAEFIEAVTGTTRTYAPP